ncbi:MAG: conjugal transfer protein TraX [Oscillospiraceae bacterium]|jgi:hypothetical protein|nr:conjugal transfer protein TraX [Oscillospiraceae bacterium]
MTELKESHLKYIAAFAMLCDHFAHAVPQWREDYYAFPGFFFHCIGTAAAPIFFYMLARGFRRTRSVKKYAGRLFIFACISYFPFILFFTGTPDTFRDFLRLNVIFLMFFALILLKILNDELPLGYKILGVLICSFFIVLSDWGLMGLIYILIFDFFRNNKKAILFCGIIIVIIKLNSDYFSVFEAAYNYNYKPYLNLNKASKVILYDICAIIPFLLIYAVNNENTIEATDLQTRKKSFFGKWFFYIFYPAHLLIFYLFYSLQ